MPLVSLQVPIPKYYWKVFLKVKWNGNAVQSACSIGFWMEHKTYDNNAYTNYVQSVNQIEQWTGFNLFANLPDSIEENVEANTSWQSFQNF
jgi:DNA/RNA endonuclease G (NUC1)